MSQVTVTLVFASIAEAAAALGAMGKPALATASFVTVADTKPTAPPADVQSPRVEPTAVTPKEVPATPVDPAALATALQNFAKRDNAAFGALMKQHGLKNMAAVTEAKHLHAALMSAATTA